MFVCGVESAKHSAITTVLQLCVFPRCCFTYVDAMYCAKFLYIMHSLKTPNFSSLICYDRVCCSVTCLLLVDCIVFHIANTYTGNHKNVTFYF